MRFLLALFALLIFDGPALSQATISQVSAQEDSYPAEYYLIPGTGMVGFPIGTTKRQAYEDFGLCQLPQVSPDIKRICEGGDKAGPDVPIVDSPNPVERMPSAVAAQSPVAFSILAAILPLIAGGVLGCCLFLLARGGRAASLARQSPVFSLASGVGLFSAKVMSSILVGGTFADGMDSGFGWLAWGILLMPVAYLVGRARDRKLAAALPK